MDQMRESVFACLGDISGSSFLDIFSGSGIIALEAASRQAVHVEAVESDPAKRKTLLKNVSISPVRIHCHFMNAELYVKRAKGLRLKETGLEEPKGFDFIFLDPPFSYQYKRELLSRIAASKLVSNESLILLHRPGQEQINEPVEGLKLKDSREYGRSVVDFFKNH